MHVASNTVYNVYAWGTALFFRLKEIDQLVLSVAQSNFEIEKGRYDHHGE